MRMAEYLNRYIAISKSQVDADDRQRLVKLTNSANVLV